MRGARVWAAPWSPPGEWKDSGTAENGGSLLPERYEDWANRLASFVTDADAASVPLLYLSAQNEPNYVANWETCRWSEIELTRFMRDHLGPAVEALGLGTQLLAPETQDWLTLESFGNIILADGAASAHVGAIAVHGYGGEAFSYGAPSAAGKELWVTELDDKLPGESDSDFDPTMTSGLKVARKLHDDLTIASVNAWHYWWIMPRTDLPLTSNGALTDGEALTRRAYVMGNYSKFVRPGFSRVRATGAPRRDVLVSAYRDAAAELLVIVASNLSTTDIAQRFAIEGAKADSATPWITSDELALEEQPPTEIVDGTLDFTLPARSVTTFVADIGNIAEPEPQPIPTRRPLVSNETGCSCRTPGPRPGGGAHAVIVGAVLFVVCARRRAA
jgi:glucuronoarabinoxylan endo-1,4-beta-xylanase